MLQLWDFSPPLSWVVFEVGDIVKSCQYFLLSINALNEDFPFFGDLTYYVVCGRVQG